MKLYLIILAFLISGCGGEQTDSIQHSADVDTPLEANIDCVGININIRDTKGNGDSVIYLDKSSMIDSLLYISCNDSLLKNHVLRDSVMNLSTVRYLVNRYNHISDLYFIKTLSASDQFTDIGFYPLFRHNEKIFLAGPIMLRYLKPTGIFYVKENHILYSLEEWNMKDSIAAAQAAGSGYGTDDK